MCLTITASLAVISALCGTRFRRKTNTSPTAVKAASELKCPSLPPIASSPPQSQTINPESSTQINLIESLPPPPARRQLDSNGSQSMKPKSNTEESVGGRKLSSMSMSRISRNLSSVSMRWSRKEGGGGGGAIGANTGNGTTTTSSTTSSSAQKMKVKLEKEDSIWMKTIILGEKCRVEDEDDPVIFDDRGLKITAYHRKVGSSLPVSRTNSYIDQDAVPNRPSNILVTERTGEANANANENANEVI